MVVGWAPPTGHGLVRWAVPTVQQLPLAGTLGDQSVRSKSNLLVSSLTSRVKPEESGRLYFFGIELLLFFCALDDEALAVGRPPAALATASTSFRSVSAETIDTVYGPGELRRLG